MKLTLNRVAYETFGTYGEMEVCGTVLYTVERPWFGNVRRISCIPEGTYKMILDPFHPNDPDGYMAPLLLNVPDRDQIQIHIANYPFELEGCIGVGLSYSDDDEPFGVLESRLAFEHLMTCWEESDDHEITIQEVRETMPEPRRMTPRPPETLPMPDLDNDVILAQMMRDLREMRAELPDIDALRMSLVERLWAHSVVIGNEFADSHGITKRSVLRFLLKQALKIFGG